MQKIQEAEERRRVEEIRLNWPQEFWVCENCKKAYFEEYDAAIVTTKDCCVVCSPCENDSLGG
jgi:uncharacterized protein with PIN domain